MADSDKGQSVKTTVLKCFKIYSYDCSGKVPFFWKFVLNVHDIILYNMLLNGVLCLAEMQWHAACQTFCSVPNCAYDAGLQWIQTHTNNQH